MSSCWVPCTRSTSRPTPVSWRPRTSRSPPSPPTDRSERERQQAVARFTAGLYRENDSISARTRSLGSLELLHGRAELLSELPALLDEHRYGRDRRRRSNSRTRCRRHPDRRTRSGAVMAEQRASGKSKSGAGNDVRKAETARSRRTAGVHRETGRQEGGDGKERQGRSAAAAAGRPDRRADRQHDPRSTPGPRADPARSTVRPELVSSVLDNGLRVIAVCKPGTPLVEVRLRVPFGGTSVSHRREPSCWRRICCWAPLPGTREQVDAELAMVGGHLDASVDPLRFAVTGSVLSTGLPVLLDVLADSLTEPAFAPPRRAGRARPAGRAPRHRGQSTLHGGPPITCRPARFGTHPVDQGDAGRRPRWQRSASRRCARCSSGRWCRGGRPWSSSVMSIRRRRSRRRRTPWAGGVRRRQRRRC